MAIGWWVLRAPFPTARSNAYISTVAVLPEYQKRGIGRELIQRLIADRDGIQFVLHANERAYPFYLHLDLGFEPFENVLVRRRKSADSCVLSSTAGSSINLIPAAGSTRCNC